MPGPLGTPGDRALLPAGPGLRVRWPHSCLAWDFSLASAQVGQGLLLRVGARLCVTGVFSRWWVTQARAHLWVCSRRPGLAGPTGPVTPGVAPPPFFLQDEGAGSGGSLPVAPRGALWVLGGFWAAEVGGAGPLPRRRPLAPSGGSGRLACRRRWARTTSCCTRRPMAPSTCPCSSAGTSSGSAQVAPAAPALQAPSPCHHSLGDVDTCAVDAGGAPLWQPWGLGRGGPHSVLATASWAVSPASSPQRWRAPR